MRQSILSIIFTGLSLGTFAQDTLSLSLNNVINLAIMQSPDVKNAFNRNVNFYWRYRNFKTMNMPKLTLAGDIPDYARTTEAVTQPDGSIKFIPTETGEIQAKLNLSQRIAATGTQIYAYSTVYRIQNYRDDITEFSGEPFIIGFSQPILNYNWMKWHRRTEPLVYEEAQKDFVETLEHISYWATVKYFKYLRVLTDYSLAQNNLRNSKANLSIAGARKELGRISENDFSRIKLSVFNARKALNTAQMNLRNADFELKSYVGIDQNQRISLEIPVNMQLFDIDAEKALAEALENRKETPQYERRLIEAEREVVRAKRNSGMQATLHGRYGLSKNGDYLGSIYTEPETSQQIKISVSIPILDWGYSESTVKLAESKFDLTVFDVNKDREDFERKIIMQAEQFSLLKMMLETSESADRVANNGYQIAQRKFQNGEISITDLNIALQERESARRDYIRTIEAYWRAYYNLRILTLYDFELNEKIGYMNPLLKSELSRRGRTENE